jgi:serpin B
MRRGGGTMSGPNPDASRGELAVSISKWLFVLAASVAVVSGPLFAEQPRSLATFRPNTIAMNQAIQAASSSNQFAFDLFQELKNRPGNLFVSPASISTALAMTYGGAASHTRQEMATVLHFGQDQKVHEGFATLLTLLNSTGDRNGYTLNTANRLWGAKSYPFEDAFLRLTRDQYRAELESIDFTIAEQARQKINQWVESQTRNKIVDLIAPGVLEPDTRLVLVNAIYFQGGWSSEFEKSLTQEAPFHATATQQFNVPTMQQTEGFAYTEDDAVQVLSMPYRGHELSMLVVLPKAIDGLSDVESKLTMGQFNRWTEGLRAERPVEVYLPKFAMRSQFQLSDTLRSMGMESAFSDRADFSAMSRSETLMLTKAIHQAFVDVDEQGTEAAAATAIIAAPTSALVEPVEPPKPVVFRADHPFLFVIRDHRTDAILFLGRVTDPRKAP